MALNLRQTRFIESYFTDANGNATVAAREAGYSGDSSTLAVTGHRVLNSDNVKATLAGVLTPEGVQEELSKVATLPADLLGALPSKVRSLELLGKMHGLWSDKLTIGLDREAVEAAISERLRQLAAPADEAQVVDSVALSEPNSRD